MISYEMEKNDMKKNIVKRMLSLGMAIGLLLVSNTGITVKAEDNKSDETICD